MANLERDKQLILGRLGQEARRILEDFGIDVELAAKRVLQEREQQPKLTRKTRLIELRNLPISDILTSELVQLCALPGDNLRYKQELQRRLSLIELTTEQKGMFVALDLAALEKKDPRLKEEGLALGYHIDATTTVETLPDPVSCFTSELIMVIDDANAAWVRDHEWLPDAAINAIGLVKGSRHYDAEKQAWVTDVESPFMAELERRFNLMGLEFWQRNSFVKNESLIASRAKWGYSPSEESWTAESITREEK